MFHTIKPYATPVANKKVKCRYYNRSYKGKGLQIKIDVEKEPRCVIKDKPKDTTLEVIITNETG